MPADIALTIFNLKKSTTALYMSKNTNAKNSYLCTRFPLITYYLLLIT